MLPEFDFFDKRRKKKLRNCLDTTIACPYKPLTAYAIFVKKVISTVTLQTRKEYAEQRK